MPTITEPDGVSLSQTELWIDRVGRTHQVDEMSVRYKTNVVAFLERRAPRIVGRALARAYHEHVSKMLAPVPCVACEGLNGDGSKKVHRWEHGVDHSPLDFDKYPEEVDAIIGDLPSVTTAEAIDMVRRTPFVARLLEDIAHGRGGEDG